MVAISAPAKVLVTGANGYLATWVVKKYLEAGYSVRGTVRSLSKSAFLNDKFGQYGNRFELVVVEDITKDGAFDEAVKGVDVIAHTASPFHFNSTNPDDLIIPAVRGTTSILISVLKYGSSVKRVVLTSSVVAVFEWVTVPHVFTESNWNNAAVEAVKAKDSAVDPFTIYMASKTLAEKAAWEFIAAHKSEISWDLVALNPVWIFGPSLSPAGTVNDINASQREIYDTLSGARTGEQLRGQGSWVHVAVVAEAHVRATHAAAVGGERILLTSSTFFYQDFLDLAGELGIPNVPRGEPGSTKGIAFNLNLESKKSEELLGLNPTTPLKDVLEESAKDFKARGYPGFTA
jgi:nucleoside-diphosphate-sugar epimerase